MPGEELRIEKTIVEGKIPLLLLTGAINVNTFDKLESHLHGIFGSGNYTVLIDLAGVRYVSSAGAGVLMNAYMQCHEHGGKLVLVRMPESIHDVLDLLNIHDVIPSAVNLGEALKLLKP
ncbi:MAG TPA: STAS domain-containing protein [Planctomycetota bacterium]|jgi:anti-anti-sigma factor